MHLVKYRLVILATGLGAALGTVSCDLGSEVVKLKMAHGLATSHPVHKAMEFMARKALEKERFDAGDRNLSQRTTWQREGVAREIVTRSHCPHKSVQQHVGKFFRGVQSFRPSISV